MFTFIYEVRLCKKFCFVSKSQKKVRLEMWCDGENESFIAEGTFCNIQVNVSWNAE